jgi:Uma2 family endonuclease
LHRTVKLRKYATAGIAQYWIVNLQDNRIEVSVKPLAGRYTQCLITPERGMRLALDGGRPIDIFAADI